MNVRVIHDYSPNYLSVRHMLRLSETSICLTANKYSPTGIASQRRLNIRTNIFLSSTQFRCVAENAQVIIRYRKLI